MIELQRKKVTTRVLAALLAFGLAFPNSVAASAASLIEGGTSGSAAVQVTEEEVLSGLSSGSGGSISVPGADPSLGIEDVDQYRQQMEESLSFLTSGMTLVNQQSLPGNAVAAIAAYDDPNTPAPVDRVALIAVNPDQGNIDVTWGFEADTLLPQSVTQTVYSIDIETGNPSQGSNELVPGAPIELPPANDSIQEQPKTDGETDKGQEKPLPDDGKTNTDPEEKPSDDKETNQDPEGDPSESVGSKQDPKDESAADNEEKKDTEKETATEGGEQTGKETDLPEENGGQEKEPVQQDPVQTEETTFEEKDSQQKESSLQSSGSEPQVGTQQDVPSARLISTVDRLSAAVQNSEELSEQAGTPIDTAQGDPAQDGDGEQPGQALPQEISINVTESSSSTLSEDEIAQLIPGYGSEISTMSMSNGLTATVNGQSAVAILIGFSKAEQNGPDPIAVADEIFLGDFDGRDPQMKEFTLETAVSPNAVKTGEAFTYEVKINAKVPQELVYGISTYRPLYKEATNTVVHLQAPKGIELTGTGTAEVTQESESEDGTWYSFSVGSLSIGENSVNKDYTVGARMTENGTAPNGTEFKLVDAYLETTVLVDLYDAQGEATGEQKEYTLKTYSDFTGSVGNLTRNLPVITNLANSEWAIAKSIEKQGEKLYSINGDEITLQYKISVGLDGGNGQPSSDKGLYDTFGRLFLQEKDGVYQLSVTDTLPQPMGNSGKPVKPLRAEMKMGGEVIASYDGSGEPVLTATGKYQPDTSSSQYIPHGDAGYTDYTVSVTYPKEEFILPVGESEGQNYQVENKALLTYSLVGGGETTKTAADSSVIGIQPTTSGLQIQKQIVTSDGKIVKDYTPETAKEYQGGVEFTIERKGNLADSITGNKDTAKKLVIQYNESGEPIGNDDSAVVVDGTTGTVTSGELRTGKYLITETKVPEGTKAAGPQTVEVKAGSVTKVLFQNVIEKGVLQITKTGKIYSDSKPLAGAEFSVYTSEDCTGEAAASGITDDKGILTLYLASGTYWLKETKIPEGYTPALEKQKIVIESGKQTAVQVENVYEKGSVTVTKKVKGGGQIPSGDQAGFSFSLYKSTESTVDAAMQESKAVLVKSGLTLTNSAFTVQDLPLTENGAELYYYISEDTAPDGYEKLNTWTSAGKLKPGEKVSVEIVNNPKMRLSITKKTTAPGKNGSFSTTATAGVSFKLWKEDGGKLIPAAAADGQQITVTTGKGGKAQTAYLPEGTYYWEEMNIPADTVLKNAVEKEKAEGGTVSVIPANPNKNKDVTATNVQQKATLGILKKDSKTGKTLAGAKFKVERLTGKGGTVDSSFPAIPELVSTTGTVWAGEGGTLSPGWYRITETEAPPHYTISSKPTQERELKAGQKGTVTFQNDPWPTITIDKKVIYNNDVQVGKGAIFEVYYKADGELLPYQLDGKTVTIKTDGSGKGTAGVEPGKQYYVYETKSPGILPDRVPEAVIKANPGAELIDGKVYFPVGINKTTTIKNMKGNSGTIRVKKVDSVTGQGLRGARFVLKKSDGSIYRGDDKGPVTNGDGIATFSGVDIFANTEYGDNAGERIEYTIEEVAAPAGYIKSNEQLKTYAKVSDTGIMGVDKDGNDTVELIFKNTPTGNISVTKTLTDNWNGFSKKYAGVTFALYQQTPGEPDSNYILVADSTQITGDDGVAAYLNIPADRNYLIAEVASNGASPENGKRLAADEDGEPLETIPAGEAESYSACIFDQAGWIKVTVNQNQTEETERIKSRTGELRNHLGWVQFQIEKRDQDNPETLLNFAKFQLYQGADVTSGMAVAGFDPSGLVLIGDKQSQQDYFETGTAADQSGAPVRGIANTGRLEDGKVYWLKESAPPPCYQNDEKNIVLLLPKSAEGNVTVPEGVKVLYYTSGEVTKVVFQNVKLDGGGGGTGGYRLAQIRLKKLLVNENDPSKKTELPSVKFKVWLTDANGNKIGDTPLSIMETGLDGKGGEVSSGTAVSNSINLWELYQKDWGEVPNPIIHANAADGQQESLTGRFVLEEYEVPFGVTMDKQEYPLSITVTKDPSGEETIINSAVFEDTWYLNPILNYQDKKYPVSLNKYGYQRADGLKDKTDAELNALVGNRTPLGNVEITIYDTKGMPVYENKTPVKVTTDANGHAYLRLPNGNYFAVETNLGGHEDLYENVHANAAAGVPFTVLNGNTEVDLFNPEMPLVQITKRGPAGAALDKVTFTLKGSVTRNVSIKGDGTGQIRFPAGTYQVSEQIADGSGMTDRYFAAQNAEKINITVGWQGDNWLPENTLKLEYTNPGVGSLTIQKQNQAGEPLPGAAFEVAYRAFSAEEWNSLDSLPDAPVATGGFEKIKLSNNTTDSQGKITISDTEPGWYQITETKAPEGYTKNVVPVYAKVLAGADGTGTAVTATVTNAKKGSLELKKVMTNWELSSKDAKTVAFSLLDSSMKLAADMTVTLDADGTGSSKAENLEPGKYYLLEESPKGWIQDKKEGGLIGGQWDKGPKNQYIEIEIKADETKEVTVKNLYAGASIEVTKLDEASKAGVAGAVFRPYTTINGNKTYLDQEENPQITDETGKAVIPITFQQDWYDNMPAEGYEIWLEETKVPSSYEKPLKDVQVEQRLTPGAVIKLEGDKAITNKQGFRLELKKYNNKSDASNRDPLEGAPFTLYKVEGESLEKVGEEQKTHSDGTLTFENLAAGTQYALAEGKMEGYLGLEKVTVNGTALEQKTIGTQTVYLLPTSGFTEGLCAAEAYNIPLGSLIVEKTVWKSDGKGAPINGAEFTLYRCEDEQGSNPQEMAKAITSGEGRAEFKNLEAGWYKAVETKAADGYVLTPEDPRTPISKIIEVKPSDNTPSQRAVTLEFQNVSSATPELALKKTAEETELESLLNGEREANFILSGFAEGENQRTIQSFILTDREMKFLGEEDGAAVELDDSYTKEKYTIQTISVGAASAMDYSGGTGARQDLTAKVTAYGFDGAELGSVTTAPLISETTVSITAIANGQKVKSFSVQYLSPDGIEAIGPEMKAGDVKVNFLLLKQEGGPDRTEVTKIKNLASVKAVYDAEATLEKESDAAIVVLSDQNKPKVSLKKAVSPAGQVSVGDELTYTLTLKNEEADGEKAMVDPVILDALPEDLTLVRAWNQSESYQVKLPKGLTAAGFVVSDTADGQKPYAALKLKGALKPGESVVLTIKAKVLATAASKQTKNLRNQAFATSLKRLTPTKENPGGSSFYADMGGQDKGYGSVPQNAQEMEQILSSALEGKTGFRYVTAEVENPILQSNNVAMYKYGSGKEGNNFVTDGSNIFVEPGGILRYKLILRNNSSENGNQLGNIRIIDVLPEVGDKTLLNRERNSRWAPVFDSIESVSIVSADGSTTPVSNYTAYFTSSLLNGIEMKDLLNAAQTELPAPSGWSTNGDQTTRTLMVDIPKETPLGPNGQVEVVVKTNVPSAISEDQDNGIDVEGLSFTLSVNDCNATYCTSPTSADEPVFTPVTQHINSPQVKALFQPGSARMGNRVWIDENYDGLQNGSGSDGTSLSDYTETIKPPTVSFTLYEYTNDSSDAKTVSTASDGDGFYYYENLKPAVLTNPNDSGNYTKDGVNPKKLKGSNRTTYKVVVDNLPDGYILTKPYAGNGGSPTAGAGSSSESSRLEDSSFRFVDGHYESERFFIPPGTNGQMGQDLSIDLGLTKIRDLEITKLSTDGAPVEHTVFGVYGPYSGNELDAAQNSEEIDSSKLVTTLETDQNGSAKLASNETIFLTAFDSYLVREISAAPGYTIEGAKAYLNGSTEEAGDIAKGVIIPGGDSGAAVSLKVVDQRRSGSLVVRKTDGADLMLSGAEFTLRPGDGTEDYVEKHPEHIQSWNNFLEELKAEPQKNVAVRNDALTLISGEEGAVLVKLLPYGSYQLEEAKAPSGYQLDEGIQTVQISEETKDVVADMVNTLITGSLEIEKVSSKDETLKLEGAVFYLTRVKDSATSLDIWENYLKALEEQEGLEGISVQFTSAVLTTNSQGVVKLEGIPMGSYLLREQTPPEGYQAKQEEWRIQIDENNKTIQLTVQNELMTGELSLLKVSSTDQTAVLPGAVFELARKDGNVEQPTWAAFLTSLSGEASVSVQDGKVILTTDEQGKAGLKGIPAGSYTLTETKAPEGFEITQAVQEIEIDGKGKPVELVLENQPQLGGFSLKKVSSTNPDAKLVGARFEFYREDGDTTKPAWTRFLESLAENPDVSVQEGKVILTTDSEGQAGLQEIPLDRYLLKEIAAPAGYLLDQTEHSVVVEEAGQEAELTVENTPSPDNPPTPDYPPTPDNPPIPDNPVPPVDPTPNTPERDTPTPRTTTPTPTPVSNRGQTTVPIDDEAVPLAQLPPENNGLVTINDDDVPLGKLPRTGGFPVSILSILGAALFGAGWALDRKKKLVLRREKKQ